MNVTDAVTSGNYAIMERPRGAGNTDRGLTRQIAPTRSEGSVEPSACAIKDCPKPAYCRGWCTTHYTRWRMHGSELWEPPKFIPSVCEADGCARVHYCQGYCVMHYSRLRNHGTPYSPAKYVSGEMCEAPECEKASPRGRYCVTHKARLQRLGGFDLPPKNPRHMHSMGYVILRADGHPTANPQGYAYEHRVVLHDAIGPGDHDCHWCGSVVSWDLSYPQDGDAALVVDHLDETKANNERDNLVPSCAPCNISRSSRWVKRRRKESAA